MSYKLKAKSKWIVIQERGGDIPLAPPTFVLYLTYTSKIIKKVLGAYGSDVLIIMSKNGGKFATIESQWSKFCDVCYKKVIKNRFFLHFLKKELNKEAPVFLKFCSKLYKTDLSKVSKKKLWEDYDYYTKLYGNMFPYGEPIAFGSRYQLEEELKNYLKNVLEKQNHIEKFNDYFKLLITSKDIPFTTKEEIELLRIAVQINKNRKYKNLFNKSIPSIVKKLLVDHPKLDNLLNKHEENFIWVPYNYNSIWWTKKDFIKRLKKELSNNPEKKLKSLIDFYKQLSQKQRKIYKELRVDKKHKELFEAIQTNSYLIDRKKEVYTKSHFYINKSLIPEIAKRIGLVFNEVTLLIPKEIKRALLQKKIPSKKLLRERWDFLTVIMSKGKYEIYQGESAKEFLRKIKFEVKEADKVEEIKGTTAMQGRTKGIVRVLMNAKELHKMRKGNILVTFMTTPDFIFGVKKAAALVTNEGGLTCHAAIISRELGIPCIVGTKIATQVLKDGDLVEVDADKGVVKILKRAE